MRQLDFNTFKNKLAMARLMNSVYSEVTIPRTLEDRNKNSGTVLKNSISETLKNAAPAGFEQIITTLTKVKAEVIGQVFYTENPAEFLTVKIGDGAWAEEIIYYKNFQLSGKFSDGFIGAGKTRKESPEIGYDTIKLKNQFWANQFDYDILSLNQANANQLAVSLVSEKEAARKKAWDLGIQETAFLGVADDSAIDGLLTLNNQGVAINGTVITKPIKSMTSAEFDAFIGSVIGAYFTNSKNTVLPDTFILPTRDLLGTVNFISDVYPVKSKLEYIREAFAAATNNPNFQVKAVQYADLTSNALGVNRYVLYKNSSETLEMNIPVNYTSTTFGTTNGFDFENVAYGQFSGVIAKRPAEILYFDHAVSLA